MLVFSGPCSHFQRVLEAGPVLWGDVPTSLPLTLLPVGTDGLSINRFSVWIPSSCRLLRRTPSPIFHHTVSTSLGPFSVLRSAGLDLLWGQMTLLLLFLFEAVLSAGIRWLLETQGLVISKSLHCIWTKTSMKHVSRVCVLQVQFLTEILPLQHPLGSLVLLFSSISGRALPFCDLDLFSSFFALVSLPN